MNPRKSLLVLAAVSVCGISACSAPAEEETSVTQTVTATTTATSTSSTPASSSTPTSSSSEPEPSTPPAEEAAPVENAPQNFFAPAPAPEPAPAPAPAYEPAPAPAAPDMKFSSCKEALAAGYSHMTTGSPGYSTNLDRDGDGVACDKVG
ncbi:excalibur calcium-binding domain-containing protein [uncultured Corynebacterium sp.]|uniref:excalibur calcium-binding domain-containing protein n=1 Tax=uncultured Corynebacterium sp. TaxID=159447 RepID=UPI00259979A5|nr:excalibur calcium-binding domain-containing protein [uncultured Corynebacterium sp.]